MPSPGGAPLRCLSSAADYDRLQYSLGLGLGQFETTLNFDNDQDVDVEMTTVTASGAWLINERWTARANVGLILDGTLATGEGAVHAVKPGGTVGIGAQYQALVGAGKTPTIDFSMSLGVSLTQTTAPDTNLKTDYFAADARLGIRAGWSLNNGAYPYLAARIFGGPVHWEMSAEEVVGSDIHHYQGALGIARQVGSVGLFAEWAGLGETALSGGLSTAW